MEPESCHFYMLLLESERSCTICYFVNVINGLFMCLFGRWRVWKRKSWIPMSTCKTIGADEIAPS